MLKPNKQKRFTPIANSVFVWKVGILLNEIKSRDGFSGTTSLDHIKSVITTLDANDRDIIIENITPKLRNYKKDTKYLSRLNGISILRIEILNLLDVMKDKAMSDSETVSTIINILNHIPAGYKNILNVFIQYNKVIDYILPNQYQDFYQCIALNEPPQPYRICNRLYHIFRFKQSNPQLSTESLLDFVRIQKGLLSLFDDDGVLPNNISLNVRENSHEYTKLLNWIPKDLEDFNSVYESLLTIREELKNNYGIELIKSD